MLTIHNLKVHDDMSEETMCFSADLRWKDATTDQHIGHIRNHGTGGESVLFIEKAYRERVTAFLQATVSERYNAWYREHIGEPDDSCPGDVDLLDHLVNEAADRQADQSALRQLKADRALRWRSDASHIQFFKLGPKDDVEAIAGKLVPKGTTWTLVTRDT